jgi:murein L,D-transpeptidase YcbB/YkuD
MTETPDVTKQTAKKTAPAKKTAEVKPAPKPAPPTRPNLEDGARGIHVVFLETLLQARGLYERSNTSGMYGTTLMKSVRKAQSQAGMKITGKVDQALWAWLQK